MMIAAMIKECDYTGKVFKAPVKGYHVFARGATGRVCHVLNVCAAAVKPNRPNFFVISTLKEVEEWAESIPGGYLDY